MKTVKNILLVTKEYKTALTPKVGGTGIFYSQLARELVKKGIKVHVFLISNKNFDVIENGVYIHSVKDIFKADPLLEMIRSMTGKTKNLERLHFSIYLYEKKKIAEKINTWIKKNDLRFDLAETHDFDGLALSIPKEIPYVIRCHGSWSVLKKYFGYKKVQKGRVYCEEKAFENAQHVISISRFNEKINRDLFSVKDPQLIYNGIDINFYKPDSSLNIIPQSIFYLGNVSFEKGADALIKAFLLIKEKYPESSLHFIGNINGYDQFFSKFTTVPEVRQSVVFYGNKDSKEIVNLANQAEVMCFPSKGENFSLSLLEAMAMQKPVICSGIEAFTEVIQDGINGLVADKEDFAEKICLVFEDPDLKTRISYNARKSVETDFAIDKMIIETINYYNKII